VARALGIAPNQLIRVEIRGVAWQVMHGQLAVELCHVVLDREGLVGGQSIEEQMQGFGTSAHHPAQQVHEHRARQCARIRAEPKAPLALTADTALMR